jgi:hypothetical protein
MRGFGDFVGRNEVPRVFVTWETDRGEDCAARKRPGDGDLAGTVRGDIHAADMVERGSAGDGALLCLNRRTICSALRAVDGAADKGFSRFHRFLSRGVWSGLEGSRILLGLLVKAFVPDGFCQAWRQRNEF